MRITGTYRLQFREGMTFDRAADIAPYIARLGASHLYASPIYAATTGSTHGYDVTDHNAFDPALGGREGFDRLSAALKREGLGLILDIVPNHMAASVENPWWRDVLHWGGRSRFSRHFDIDWSERLTLPILGADFSALARDGEIRILADADTGALVMTVPGAALPLDPASYATLFAGSENSPGRRLASLAATAEPATSDAFANAIRKLLADESGPSGVQAWLDQRFARPGALEAAHDAQPWRLIHWKDGRRHLSYRRFFEVTGLVGVRVEDETVFQDVHGLTLELVAEGLVDGLRIDHVDGLADPAGYLKRLRQAVGPDLPIHVEKILGHGEALPRDWPVAGTTGYEFITNLTDLLVDDDGVRRLTASYAETIGRNDDPAEEIRKAKIELVTRNFEGELDTLARIAAERSGGQDPARQAIAGLIAELPVYRSYATPDGLGETDARLLEAAATEAMHHQAQPEAIAGVLSLVAGDQRDAQFLTRFQQLSGPVMAKALEDTFFYRHHPLIALNEVGGHPHEPLGGAAGFHEAMAARLREQPEGLSATSTHDTKRGEDARARLYALSEHPDAWSAAFRRWDGMNDAGSVEPETRWMIFQALVGVWPKELRPLDRAGLDALRDRFLPFLEKALREAKLRTDWLDPDEQYERRVASFASGLLSRSGDDFRLDFAAWMAPIIRAGRINGLSQTLAKLLAPGIPDIYQGSEGEDFSLVDPDNRRMPDFAALERSLSGPSENDASLTKHRLIAAGLKLRKDRSTLFAEGDYLPLDVSGPAARHVFGFARRSPSAAVVAIGLRMPFAPIRAGRPFGDLLADTRLALPEKAGAFTEVIGRAPRIDRSEIDLAPLLDEDFPVAILATTG